MFKQPELNLPLESTRNVDPQMEIPGERTLPLDTYLSTPSVSGMQPPNTDQTFYDRFKEPKISPTPRFGEPNTRGVPINDGPVPGQSLTSPPGNAKYEKPPQYARPQDAAEAVWKQLTKPQNAKRLMGMLKMGMPVEGLVRTILMTGFSEGKWTPDVGMLIAKPVTAMIIALGKSAKVNMTMRMPGAEKDPTLTKMADLTVRTKKIDPKDKKKQFLSLLDRPGV